MNFDKHPSILAFLTVGLILVVLLGALICTAINIAISPIILGIICVIGLLVLVDKLCDKR